MLVGKGGAAGDGRNAGELALVAQDPRSWGVWGGAGDVRGKLQQRAGAGGPVALSVSFGGLGCSGSIPGCPR